MLGAGLLVLFVAGAWGNECIKAEVSCDPSANHCCQGPGLMTCRLRPNGPEGYDGEAYKCGPEFLNETVKNPHCIPEGSSCAPDDATSSCCQKDREKKLTCQPRVSSNGLQMKTFACMAVAPMLEPSAAQVMPCIPEGKSCDPVENKCCQPGGALRGLHECQLKVWSNSRSRGTGYLCAKAR